MMAWRVVTLEILQGALGDEREHFCRWCGVSLAALRTELGPEGHSGV
jgi:hypothetical protein